MTHDLAALLGPDGVARSTDLRQRVDRHTLGAWVAHGRLLRPFPGVLVLPDRAEEWHTRALAATLASRGALSHTSALTVWRLAPPTTPLHVSVPAARKALQRPGLVVHRVRVLDADRIGALPVTDLARSLVDTWGSATSRTGRPRDVEMVRAAVITCLRERRVHVSALREEAARRPTLPGAAALGELLRLVESGCQSELEIWGVREVLSGPGLPCFIQQYPVRVSFGTVHLDAAVPELQVGVELDGAAYHASAEARERDTRRDVALAAQGWVVLRFSYRRLRTQPESCRREIAAVCASRRSLLR